MLTDSRKPFVDFLFEFWQATGKDDLTTKQLGLLQQSAAKLEISDELPRSIRDETVGAYSSARRAVWLNTAAVAAWLTPKDWATVRQNNARGRYSDSKGHVTFRLAKFVRNGGVAEFWRERRFFGVPNTSVLLHADFAHILWFAARTEAEIRAVIVRNKSAFGTVRENVRFDQLLRQLDNAQRHFIINERLVAQTQERRLLVCGTANLTPPLVQVARALATVIINDSSFTLVHGGRRKPPFVTTDEAIGEAAAEAVRALGKKPEERIVTVMPGVVEHDRVRVAIGKAEVLPDTLYDTRRMGMVHSSDAVISIAGVKTRDLINVAWGMEKPVLPLAFTGGASLEFWDRYRDAIIKRMQLTADEVRLIEQGDAGDVVAKRCIAIMKRCLG